MLGTPYGERLSRGHIGDSIHGSFIAMSRGGSGGVVILLAIKSSRLVIISSRAMISEVACATVAIPWGFALPFFDCSFFIHFHSLDFFAALTVRALRSSLGIGGCLNFPSCSNQPPNSQPRQPERSRLGRHESVGDRRQV